MTDIPLNVHLGVKTDICAWCKEPQDEHVGFGLGCEEFIPVNWRDVAHALLDRIILQSHERGLALAVEDSRWLKVSLRLRDAVVRAQEEV